MTTSTVAAPRVRLDSIDFVRGLIMAIMALDHARDYVHRGALQFDPTDLSHTTVAVFLTRWITHFCAPSFVFLAGLGAWFAGRRRTKPQLSWFLLTRGVWLVVLEFTLVNFVWSFAPNLNNVVLQVIWVLGCSMILLAGLIWLPRALVVLFGLALVFGHNAFDGATAAALHLSPVALQLLHSGGMLSPAPGMHWEAFYPLIPWPGIMALGWALGALWERPPAERTRALVGIGFAATAMFVVLRATNVYGDPGPWSAQVSPAFTVLSFLRCEKYPPSLLFTLMTLGPMLLVLAAAERRVPKFAGPLVTFGRVPLFFYVLHIAVIHALILPLAFAKYGPSILTMTKAGPPADWGFPLWVVYVVWIGVLALIMYPSCRWFAGVKARSRSPLMSYL